MCEILEDKIKEISFWVPIRTTELNRLLSINVNQKITFRIISEVAVRMQPLFPNDYGAKRPSTQSDNEDMSECFKSLVQSQELDF